MNRLFNKKLLFVLVWFLPLTQAYSMNFSARSIDFSLSNGLNVVLIKDTRSPIVVSSIWYKVGSSYEREGISGISHILEHLMFKGTKTMQGNLIFLYFIKHLNTFIE